MRLVRQKREFHPQQPLQPLRSYLPEELLETRVSQGICPQPYPPSLCSSLSRSEFSDVLHVDRLNELDRNP
eukprot:635938-Pleurochrysis_carterae.AAC.4